MQCLFSACALVCVSLEQATTSSVISLFTLFYNFLVLSPTHTHTHTHFLLHILSNTSTLSRSLKHTHTRAHSYTHTRSLPHRQTHTHRRTHTHTYKKTNTNKTISFSVSLLHTHTHTHTQSYQWRSDGGISTARCALSGDCDPRRRSAVCCSAGSKQTTKLPYPFTFPSLSLSFSLSLSLSVAQLIKFVNFRGWKHFKCDRCFAFSGTTEFDHVFFSQFIWHMTGWADGLT